MAGRVIKDFVVDLVSKNDQVVLSGNFYDIAQQIIRIQCASGVVGVDDDDCPGSAVDLGFYVFRIWQPVRLFVAYIMSRDSARQRDCSRP